MRRLVVVSLLLLALAALALVAGRWWLDRPLALPATPYAFDVRAGASLTAVARDLTAAGVLPDERVLVALARWRNVDRSIKAGNYEIVAGVTLPQLLDKLTQGDVTQASLTVVEGSTYAELRALLAADPKVARAGDPLTDAELMRRIGAPGASPEGWFFPDTYFFAAGSGEFALLQRAHQLMRTRLDAAWSARAPDLPLKDPYEALILASIVEKETGRPADRPLVARCSSIACASACGPDRRSSTAWVRGSTATRATGPRGGHALQHVCARRPPPTPSFCGATLAGSEEPAHELSLLRRAR
jgi:UPF0755 protein